MKRLEGLIIPFKISKQEDVNIGQGYNGANSHKLFPQLGTDFRYSLDFFLDMETEIIAAQGGEVIKVVDQFPSEAAYEGLDWKKGLEAAKKANYISIRHEDGTIAEYIHVSKNARVKEGDTVSQGDVIALSGSSGWSTGPHLHFHVYRKTEGLIKARTLPVNFTNYRGELEDIRLNPFTEEQRRNITNIYFNNPHNRYAA